MLIGLSGYARSGKDTVGNYLVKNYGFTRLAFADALKEFAYTLDPIVSFASYKDPVRLSTLVDSQGWDKVKQIEEVRRTLQVLGTDCGRNILGDNIWVNVVELWIAQYQTEKFVVTDCRFSNEINMIKYRKGEVWWIERDGVGPLNDHPSENTVTKKDADLFLWNTQDLTYLYSQIEALMGRENTV